MLHMFLSRHRQRRAMCAPLLGTLLAGGACSGPPEASAPAAVVTATAEPALQGSHPIRALTGARTRVVWVQDAGDGKDPFAQGTGLRLMGLDSDDGLGERPVLGDLGNYAKPMITPLGNRVVFTDRREGAVYVVDGAGSNRRRLAEGFGLAVWRDPDGREWVYVGTRYDDSEFPPYAPVHRVRIDDPEVRELVWEAPPVAEDNFQLSADGRRASGAFPWPYCGLADLATGTLQRRAEGCWASLAPDNSYILWVFDGAHRNVTLYDPNADRHQRVNINGAPGMNGSEVYHPRWSNHPRFLAVTGPYTVGGEANKIRGGGTGVEVHLGRFSLDLSRIESWVRVTDNAFADFYPDVWVDPAGPSAAPPVVTLAPAPATPPDRPSARLVVEATLVEAGAMPTPDSIAPYRSALLVNTYRVERVLEGTYGSDRIIVAHWVIRDAIVLASARRGEGERYRLTLNAFDDHPELEGQRLVMDTDEFDLALYYDVGS